MRYINVITRVSEDSKHAGDVTAIAIFNDKLITAAEDGKIKVWSKDLALIQEFQAHDYAINAILIFENILYTASVDLSIKCWRLENYELRNTIVGHEEPVRKLKSDGEYIFAGDDKGEVRMWTKDGILKCIYSVLEEVWDLHIEGNLIYSIRDKDLVITERVGCAEKYTVIFTCPGRSPIHITEKQICLLDRTGRIIQVRNKSKNAFENVTELSNHNLMITALTGWDNLLASADWENKISIWDLTDGILLTEGILPIAPTTMVVTGSELFFGGPDGYLGKFQLDSMNELYVLD